MDISEGPQRRPTTVPHFLCRFARLVLFLDAPRGAFFRFSSILDPFWGVPPLGRGLGWPKWSLHGLRGLRASIFIDFRLIWGSFGTIWGYFLSLSEICCGAICAPFWAVFLDLFLAHFQGRLIFCFCNLSNAKTYFLKV